MSLPPVEALLPHRPPFLFLDELLELSESGVRARRTVRGDEPQFLGHYPGRPIMPGVLLCEAVLQAGCCLMAHRSGAGMPKGDPVVTRMGEVKFKRMVVPGDVLEISAEHVETKLGAHFMKGQVRVGGKIAASLEFAVSIVAKSEGAP